MRACDGALAACATITSQRALPGLADELMAETRMRLAGDARESRALIDAVRLHEDAVGAQRGLRVAHRAAEADAFVDPARPAAECAPPWLGQEQAELRHAL